MIKSLNKGGGFWDDVNGGYLPEDLELAAERQQIEWVHCEDVYEIVPMQECEDAGQKRLELLRVDTDKSVDPERLIEIVCLRMREEEARHNSKSLIYFSVVLCNATSRSCEGVGLNHDVCELIVREKGNH